MLSSASAPASRAAARARSRDLDGDVRAHAGEHAGDALAEHGRQLACQRQRVLGGDEQQPRRVEAVDLAGQAPAAGAGAEHDPAGERDVDEAPHLRVRLPNGCAHAADPTEALPSRGTHHGHEEAPCRGAPGTAAPDEQREAVERQMRERGEDRDLVDTVSEEQRRERDTVEDDEDD